MTCFCWSRGSRNGWEKVLEGTELRACVRHTQQPGTGNVNGGMQKEAGEVLQHSIRVGDRAGLLKVGEENPHPTDTSKEKGTKPHYRT